MYIDLETILIIYCGIAALFFLAFIVILYDKTPKENHNGVFWFISTLLSFSMSLIFPVLLVWFLIYSIYYTKGNIPND